MENCHYVIDSLPSYTPQLIAFLIALVEFIIVIIAYIAREAQRKKTFYGREDFEDIPEEEKMEHEGAVMGKNNEELHIVQSADRTAETDAGTVTIPNGSGVKVMVRRKKRLPENADSLKKEKAAGTDSKMIRFMLEIDWTTRGFEFITVLQKALEEIEEFKNIQAKLSDNAQDRLCDFIVHKMRTILEESTQHRWLVYGVFHNKIWKVSGLENLLEKSCGDIRTQQMLRITAHGPIIPITVFAYMIEIDMKLDEMKMQSVSPIISRQNKNKIRDESPTQSISRTFEKTPQVKPKYSPVTPTLATPTNYLPILNTMSTMPSEKLPTVVDTFQHSRSSKKETSATSTKQKKTLSKSYNRKGSVGQMRKLSVIKRHRSSETDPRSKFRSYHSKEKSLTERTQTEQ